MTSGFFNGDILRGLAVRVLFFLSLTLLPLGLIAVQQTREVSRQSSDRAELALLAVTEEAAIAEALVLQQAFSAAKTLAAVISTRRDSGAECSQILREYSASVGTYRFLGYLPREGEVTCKTGKPPAALLENGALKAAIDTGAQNVTTAPDADNAGYPMVIVSTPVFYEGAATGLLTLTIPFATFGATQEPDLTLPPRALITFNQNGEVLTTEKPYDRVEGELPRDQALKALAGDRAAVFRGENTAGQERVFALLPIVPNVAYALGVWPANTPHLAPGWQARLNELLPLLMWAASLVVTFWAIHRLAITHITKLGRQMRRFAVSRTVPRGSMDPSVPAELLQMERNFVDMADAILRDEARLEDSLRQKNILLKEVHHRVKNNLQLISSIMNMQIRQAKGDDARFVLKRLQERILSLATVHENLYKDDAPMRAEVSAILGASVNQLLLVGLAPGSNVKVKQHYEKITIDPDDAAPLTLLVSEAVTNALKYVDAEEGEAPFIHVNVTAEGPGEAKLVVENSVTDTPKESGTGLGSKLIAAFCRQLSGSMEVETPPGRHRLKVVFAVPQGQKQVLDY
ncbi:MAG: sensor histidine kinase [Pseudomonadota bacterium]